MFLHSVLRRNPALLQAGFELHRAGLIPPNCFVLDLDAIAHNTRRLADQASRFGIGQYFMTKQIGHNPPAVAVIRANGIDKTVAVDLRSALTLYCQGVPIGNIGHLSQPPQSQVRQVLRMNPEVVTLYSLEKAQAFADALETRQTVNVLLKVWQEGDRIFPGQDGGFHISQLPRVIDEIQRMPGLRIAGATSFPCIEYDTSQRKYIRTPNLSTLLNAIQILEDRLGSQDFQINAPGATCIESLPILKAAGANFGEPGHALTGTNPHNAYEDGVEIPAMIFISEISHRVGELALAFGGGVYSRGHLRHALVGRKGEDLLCSSPLKAKRPSSENIDYYFSIEVPPSADVRVGDTVVSAFRAQVFISYTWVAAVSGIQAGRPRLEGVFTGLGTPYLDWRTE